MWFFGYRSPPARAKVPWRFPAKIDPEFAEFYERVVALAGVNLPITSDWRSPEANAAASGSSPTSLHMKGRAVDLDTGPKAWKQHWLITAAVVKVAEQMGLTKQVELELVSSAKDTHIHIALDPREPGGELIVKAD